MSTPEQLIAAYLDDALTAAEEAELIAWLNADPAHLRTFVQANVRDQQLRAAVQAKQQLRLIQAPLPTREAPQPEPRQTLVLWPRYLAWAAGLILLGILSWLFLKPAPASPAYLEAGVAGVQIERGRATLAGRAGFPLQEGDVIRVPARGQATIAFAGEATRIQLLPETTVVLRGLSQAKRFELQSGKVEAAVSPQKAGAMVWTTDDAQAVVRGTKFVLAAEGLFTRLDVSEGKVEFAQRTTARPTLVQAGQFAAADANTLLEARSAAEDATAWNVPERATPGFAHTSFLSEILGREIGLNVMLPAGYQAQAQRRYPVLYLLHGFGGNEHTEAARFGAALRQAMAEGKVVPFIVVAPNVGPAFPREPMSVGLMLARELPRVVEQRYRALAFRNTRVVCGAGYGGQLAVFLAALHAEVISTSYAVDNTLRGVTPALRRMDGLLRARSARLTPQLHLLSTAEYPTQATALLAEFLNGAGVNTTAQTLAAAGLADPALPDAVAKLLASQLNEQWRPRRPPN